MTKWTGYRLRKAKCKFKPNLALAWRTSVAPAALRPSSLVAVPCSINRTNAFSHPIPFLTLPPHTGGACVWVSMGGGINYLRSISSDSQHGNWPRASWR